MVVGVVVIVTVEVEVVLTESTNRSSCCCCNDSSNSSRSNNSSQLVVPCAFKNSPALFYENGNIPERAGIFRAKLKQRISQCVLRERRSETDTTGDYLYLHLHLHLHLHPPRSQGRSLPDGALCFLYHKSLHYNKHQQTCRESRSPPPTNLRLKIVFPPSVVAKMEEANKLIGTGKKHLVMGKVVEAVSALQEACGML